MFTGIGCSMVAAVFCSLDDACIMLFLLLLVEGTKVIAQ